jgi:hypothetical protein
MDSSPHKTGYLLHVSGDLQCALGTLLACADRQMVGSSSAPIQRASRLGGHSHMASRSVRWLAGGKAVKPGVDFEEPIMMIIGPMIYAVCANLGFTLGWIVDTSLYTGGPRNRLWKAGLIFSLVLTALPGIWAVIAWCITLYTGKKFD